MSRKPVSTPQNNWFNLENVDDDNLNLEQDHNNQFQTSLIDSHLGSGVLPEVLSQNILFDSSISNGILDGKAISVQSQPSNTSEGNQIEIQLTDSKAAGKRAIKIIIIGLDFLGNLQYSTFVFSKNESQISSKHYTKILTILFNDFIGPPLQSFNLGGRIIIKETNPLSLSRDPIMISQETEPNIILRDFFVSTGGSLSNLLISSLPDYNIDNLNIKTGYKQLRNLNENDISSHIGQKFLATTNNIQKITVLLSVINNITPSNLVWTGEILISIYELQSTVRTPFDLVPNLAIEFDPLNIPISQISIDYNSLFNKGIILNTTPQPVDFIFSNTSVGSGLSIKNDHYYIFTIKRAGSPDACKIQLAIGNNTSAITRETLFNGDIWIDVPEESLWFQIWTDSAKLSDGQAYDVGQGITVPKTKVNENTNITEDFNFNRHQFLRNDVYSALLQAKLEKNHPVQDERTGQPIDSQKEFIPSISLLNINDLNNIKNISEPLIVGTITDQNVKFTNPSTTNLSAQFHSFGFTKNEIVFKIIDDISDGYRYDQSIVELVSELVNGNLNGAKIIPDINSPSIYYRIAKSELLTMTYGDIDGNGIIDTDDLLVAQKIKDADLNVFPSYNEYIVKTTFFINDINLNWKIIDPAGPTIITTGTDGILTVNALDGTLANFQSSTADFNTILNLDEMKLVITGSTTSSGNNSSFFVVDLIDNNNITIEKLYYNSETILKILRSDINNDMISNTTDSNLITNYINLLSPFQSHSSPANRVGTTFQAVRLTVEPYIDRADDYPSTDVNRSSEIHSIIDIFKDGYSDFADRDVKSNPITFNIIKQLNWYDYNIVVSSKQRFVPAAFNYQAGYVLNDCSTPGTISKTFPQLPAFDPGRNDYFIPNHLIINDGGQIITRTGDYFKVDLEIGTIAFEIPPVEDFSGEKTINLLSDFIADYSGTGYTRIGYPAMKFSDCSKVKMDAFVKNQARVEVALLSLSPQINGVDVDGYAGIIVDMRCGVSIDYSTGLLSLQFTNMYQDPVQKTRDTKVQITVYLKKAGWNNTPIFIESNKTINLLGL